MNKADAVRIWRETEAIPDGCHGDKTYLGFDSISSNELDDICEQLNKEWEESDSPLRVGWSMGEFYPGFKRQRELPLVGGCYV